MLHTDKNIELELIEPCNDHCSFCFLNYANVLGDNSIFKGMELCEIGKIIRNVPHKVKKFGKGDLVASEGDRLESLIIIVKGSVVGEMIDFEGRVLRVEHLTSPDTIATAFLFGDNNVLPVNVTAKEETKLLCIPVASLVQLFSEYGILMRNFLDIMANRAQFLSKQMKLLGLSTIKGKIAHYLLEQVRKQNSLSIVLKHSQNELADMFAVTRPSIGRTLRELHNEEVIEARGKNVSIKNKKALSELLR